MDFEKDIVLCEVPFGGVLFINNLVPHRRFVLLFPFTCRLTINFPTRCYQILRELGVKVILIFSDLCSARRANIIFFSHFFVTRAIDLAKTRTARRLWKSSRS